MASIRLMHEVRRRADSQEPVKSVASKNRRLSFTLWSFPGSHILRQRVTFMAETLIANDPISAERLKKGKRQIEQGEVLQNLHGGGGMPAGLVQDQDEADCRVCMLTDESRAVIHMHLDSFARTPGISGGREI